MANESTLPLQSCAAWAPRDGIAPRLARDGETFVVTSNGSAGCYGGWEVSYPLPDTPFVEVQAEATPRGLARGLDCIHAAVVWYGDPALPWWEPLLPVRTEGGVTTYRGRAKKPAGAKALSVRLTIAWSGSGEVRWAPPAVTPAPAHPPRKWRLGAAGGPLPPGERNIAANTKVYLGWCREAANAGVNLLCLPEVMLTTGMPSGADTLPQQAIRIPGPEIEPFQEFARERGIALCFSAWERDEELIHNTGVLIGKDGVLVGKYRKVHLASPFEVWWGVTPGDEIPVFQLGNARVAMNICMDSSALESARVPARLGAEILCLPIMGDHRAVRGWQGDWVDFDVERWTAIQRVRAMDNQLYMLISRNNGVGSGVFSPRGEVLAISGGARLTHAEVDLEDLPIGGSGATFRGIAWWERREPAYGPLVGNFGW